MATITESQEAENLIAQLATENKDIRFYLKVTRAVRAGLTPDPVAHFSAATAEQIVGGETWLPQLAGGGLYTLAVLDPRVPTTAAKTFAYVQRTVSGPPRMEIDHEAVKSTEWRGPPVLEWYAGKPDPTRQAPPVQSAGYAPPVTHDVRVAHAAPGSDPSAELRELRAAIAAAQAQAAAAEAARLAAEHKAAEAERKREADLVAAKAQAAIDKQAAEHARQIAVLDAKIEAMAVAKSSGSSGIETLMIKMMEESERRRAEERKEAQVAETKREEREERARKEREDRAREDRAAEREARKEERLAAADAAKIERERLAEERKDAREAAALARADEAEARKVAQAAAEKLAARNGIEGFDKITGVLSSTMSTMASAMQMTFDALKANAPAPQEETIGDMALKFGEAIATAVPAIRRVTVPQTQPQPQQVQQQLPPAQGPQGPPVVQDDGRSPSPAFMAPVMASMERFVAPAVAASQFWDLLPKIGVPSPPLTLDQLRLIRIISSEAPPLDQVQQVFGVRLENWYKGDQERVGSYLLEFWRAYSEEAVRRGYMTAQDAEQDEPEEAPEPPGTGGVGQSAKPALSVVPLNPSAPAPAPVAVSQPAAPPTAAESRKKAKATPPPAVPQTPPQA